MNQVTVNIEGRLAVIETAPGDKLKERIAKLLEGSTVSNCTLVIGRRIHPDKDVGSVTIQKLTPGDTALNVLVQTDAADGGERYKCTLTAPSHSVEELRKDLVEASKAKDLGFAVRVVEAPKAPRGPRKKVGDVEKKTSGRGTGLKGLKDNSELTLRVVQGIVSYVAGSTEPVSVRIFTKGLRRDFAPRSPLGYFGIVIKTLKEMGYLKSLGLVKVGRKASKHYQITPKALKLVGTSPMVPRAKSDPKPTEVTELGRALASLESKEEEYKVMTNEIGVLEHDLAEKRIMAEQLKSDIGALAEIRKLLQAGNS